MSDNPPTELLRDRFEVLTRIGEGAFGDVYRARDLRLDRVVALKVLKPRTGPMAEQIAERFRREVDILLRYPHPNLVPLLDAGLDHSPPYLSSTWMAGGDLKARVKEGPAPLEELVRAGVRLAEGLAHLHAHGVVHRDVKPANVFLDEAGQVFLADLGLGVTEDAEPLTATGMVVGTPHYMPPEALVEGRHSPAGDLFALGVVLLEMALGEPTREPAGVDFRLSERVAGVEPRGLRKVLRRCLRTDPGSRFASGDELAGALRELLEEEAGPDPSGSSPTLLLEAASSSGIGPRKPAPAPPRATLPRAAGAGLLALLVLGAWHLAPGSSGGPAPAPVAVLEEGLAEELTRELAAARRGGYRKDGTPDPEGELSFSGALSWSGVGVLDSLPAQSDLLEWLRDHQGNTALLEPRLRAAMVRVDGSLVDDGHAPVFRPFLEARPLETSVRVPADVSEGLRRKAESVGRLRGPGSGWARAAMGHLIAAVHERDRLERELESGALQLPKDSSAMTRGRTLLLGDRDPDFGRIHNALEGSLQGRRRLARLLGAGREHTRDACVAIQRALETPGLQGPEEVALLLITSLEPVYAFLHGEFASADLRRIFASAPRTPMALALHAKFAWDLRSKRQYLALDDMLAPPEETERLARAADACREAGYTALGYLVWKRLVHNLWESGRPRELRDRIEGELEVYAPHMTQSFRTSKLARRLAWAKRELGED